MRRKPEPMQILLFLLFVIPAVFFLLTQQGTFQRIRPENRLMNPGLVWLQCIPLFGLVWQFVVVLKLAASIQKEFLSRGDDSASGLPSPEIAVHLSKRRPTLFTGLGYCILTTLGLLINFFLKLENFMIDATTIIFLVGIACWIIYWVQLGGYWRILSPKYL